MADGRANSLSGSTGGVDAELHELGIKERSEIERYEKQRLTFTNSACQLILQEVLADESDIQKQ